MAAQTIPYNPYDGIGIYNPVRVAPLHWKEGNLNPKVSAKLYRERNKPKVFASQIMSIMNPSDFTNPSYFSQVGTGKRKKVAKKIKRGRSMF